LTYLFATSRLHFAYALGTTLFGALRIGATTILHERWPTPSTVAATMDLYKPTVVFSVPTLYHKLLETGLSQKAVFRTVRRYVSAGERLSPKIGAAWETATGRPVLDAMSCSELVHKIFTNTPTSHRAGSSGRPMPGVQVRLIDHDGAEVTNAGQTGGWKCTHHSCAPDTARSTRRPATLPIDHAIDLRTAGLPPGISI
jgi:acyl-coenzyme A synthetase/AMP-(fatty) acid ligase